MKKTIIAFLTIALVSSCGGSNTNPPIQATYDSVKPDSSNILPPLLDTLNVREGDKSSFPVPDSLQ